PLMWSTLSTASISIEPEKGRGNYPTSPVPTGTPNRRFIAREFPAVTPPTSRKRRREIISAPGREIGSGYYRGVRRRTRGRAMLLKYAVSRWLSVQAVENYKLIHPCCAPNQPEPRQISACRTPIKLTLRSRRPRVA